MSPKLAIVVGAGLLLSACGGDKDKGSSGRAESQGTVSAAAPTPAGPCPEGTRFLRARDVIGQAPPGYQIFSSDRQALAGFVAQYRKLLGTRWRGFGAKVLARRGADTGTAVIVINTRERSGGSEAMLSGAEAAKRDRGTDYERLRVGGRVGPLTQARDGAFVAIAPAGTCSQVVLVADTEKLVRTAAALLPAR